MTTVELKLDLPDQLAQDAKAAGLLSPKQIERLMREALRTRRVKKLAQARKKLATNPLPLMSASEIQAEIDAYRREVRRAAGA